jgi:capsular exopolysaccharide synthesis family protein
VSSVPIVENLRVQEVTAAARLADLQGTHAAGHPLVIDAAQALAKIREHLRDESLRAAKQLDIQTREAQSNEAQLQQRLDELTSVRHDENRLLPKLRQLEAEQASARTVYDTFEKGWYRALVQDGVPSPKGRVIQAATPTDWPAFPNVPILLAAIFVASVMVGVAVVFVFEARDKSFHTAEEIEDEVGLPVLGMSLLAPAGLRRFIGRRTPVSQQMLAKPNSALSESVRFVRSAITFAHSDQQPKVVMVTSAVPGEGKTTFALMLARLSAQSGKRVLAIEAETRRPSFGRDLSPLPKKGLTEYLTGRATFEEVLGMDRESGLHFIATRERGKFGNDLLSSAQMAALLERARQDYDFVVVDTPPSTVVADAFELGRLADSVVLVVKWACTPRHIVAQAARKLRAANIPLVGTVLTQVDTARYAAYGHGQLPYQYAKAYYITH